MSETADATATAVDGTDATTGNRANIRPTDRPINVYHVMGSLGHGGRESLLDDLIRGSPAGISHTVCALRIRDGQDERFEQLGVETVSFEASSKRDLGALWRMARFLRGHSVDVLHAHGPNAQVPGRVLAPFCGVGAVVSTVHGVESMFSDRQLQLEWLTRRLDTRTVAVSDGVRQSYIGDADDPQWETIHNGIDVESFADSIDRADPATLREEHAVDEGDVVLLNVGRYVPPKAQLDLIAAMDDVVEEDAVSDDVAVRLFVVGGRGAMEGRLRERVSNLGLADVVTVTGRVDAIEPYYALADVFVSSSVGEGLPIVQLEAMAASLPVVATDIPGVRELVVDGETGLLVPPRSPPALADAIRDVANDGELRSGFGTAGYERVRTEFHIDRTVDRYVALYREAAGRTDR